MSLQHVLIEWESLQINTRKIDRPHINKTYTHTHTPFRPLNPTEKNKSKNESMKLKYIYNSKKKKKRRRNKREKREKIQQQKRNNNNNVYLSCVHQRPERSHDTY